MSDHYWFLPSADGIMTFMAFLAILAALAVLLSMLFGEFGLGPLSGWQRGLSR